MIIAVDSREQSNSHIVRYFDKVGIEHYDSESLVCGDYYADGKVVVERKRSLIEFANNCGKQHQRFKRELERARECGVKMYILIEQPMEYQDLAKWVNPKGKTKYRRLKDGTLKEIKPMNGLLMKRICDRWKEQYDIDFVFVDKRDSGEMIIKLLEYNK